MPTVTSSASSSCTEAEVAATPPLLALPPPLLPPLLPAAPAAVPPSLGGSRSMRGRTERMYSPSLNWMSIFPLVRLARTVTLSHPKFVCTLITSPTCTSGLGGFTPAVEEPEAEEPEATIAAVEASSPMASPPSSPPVAAALPALPGWSPFVPRRRRASSLARGRALQPAIRRSTTSRTCSGVRLGGPPSLPAAPSTPPLLPFLPLSPLPSPSVASSEGCCVKRTERREVPPINTSHMLIAASWICMYAFSFSSDG
mmetsp:Transcript_37784/g.94812  ORF Transcript_37784/g.94812 Transcript_37784/m.94812 type:complete len:256 (-) Transcript_37784:1632-2399(-)